MMLQEFLKPPLQQSPDQSKYPWWYRVSGLRQVNHSSSLMNNFEPAHARLKETLSSSLYWRTEKQVFANAQIHSAVIPTPPALSI